MTTFDLRDGEPIIAYRLLTSIVVPRPIAFLSTVSASGILNLAPFSFFMVGGANPPSLMVAPTLNSKSEEKDSLRNIRETGEFVVNSVHREMTEGMNEASAPLPAHESEWPRSGFTPLASQIVKPPRVSEALVQMECRLHTVLEHGNGPISARYIIGEVLMIHVHPDLLVDGTLHSMNLLSRLGGPDYLDLASGEKFALDRPRN